MEQPSKAERHASWSGGGSPEAENGLDPEVAKFRVEYIALIACNGKELHHTKFLDLLE